MTDRDHDIADEHAAATRGPLVDALRAERAAHAATREELRRAREAQSALAPDFHAATFQHATLRGFSDERSGIHPPASPSTEAAVRAGIEAAKAAIIAEAGDASDEAVETFGARLFVLAIEDLDPAAIAARLEGR